MKDNESITQIRATIPEGYRIDMALKRRGIVPGYWMIGTGRRNVKMKIKTIDAIETMSKLTPQEWKVLQILKEDILKYDELNNKMYSSCHVSYEPKLLTPTQKAQFYTGTKRLIERGLIIREKRKHYMINPAFIIPTHYDKEETEWLELVLNHRQ
jgi:hypothetical protein